MAVSSTTKMMNLLTLVLVTLPGLTLSFSNTNPWRDLYEQLQLGADIPSPPEKPGGYVCCNQPGTRPPRPRLPHFKSLILSLAKRDDRDALLREALRDASRRADEDYSGPAGPLAIRGRRGGYSQEAEAAPREALLTRILHLLKSGGGGGGSGLTNYDGSKRGLDAYDVAGKRGENGEAGGVNEQFYFPSKRDGAGEPNQGWTFSTPTPKGYSKAVYAYAVAAKRGENGEAGGVNQGWNNPAQQKSQRFARR